MRVLWITNEPLPEALSLLDGREHVSESTGSWVCALSELMGGRVALTVASPSTAVDAPKVLQGRSVTHVLTPPSGYWKQVHEMAAPDVVHIHGTEYPHALAYVRECGPEGLVVSLQGLVSRCLPYYDGGIPESVLRSDITIRDRVRRDSHFDKKRDFERRAKCEEELLRLVHHVVGRTDWDREQSLAINPDICYHFCNEALRAPFYEGKWSVEACRRSSIFICQGYYPLKGFHMFLEALPEIVSRCPEASVRVAGPKIVRDDDFKGWLLLSGYGKYLRRMIADKGLEERVEFIGELDAFGVRRELLGCNVAVLPSLIENSPNSLGEAQILGVPVVAAKVGGVPSMIKSPSEGLMYESGDDRGLAAAVVDALTSPWDSSLERAAALKRHDRGTVVNTMSDIYREVASCR